jgi:hypothetical protein
VEKIIHQIPLISLCAGGWAVVNGMLHDVFVLKKYKVYDRELLRLLMDGHILITCGALQMIAYKGLQQNADLAYYVTAAATISLLVYCAMIFPFLKSIATITINLILLNLLIAFQLS